MSETRIFCKSDCLLPRLQCLPSPQTETLSLTTPNKFAARSTEIQTLVPLLKSETTTPDIELSNTSKFPQNVKQNSKNRRKRTKVQKPEIEIKMAKHKPRKSTPTEYTTDNEDLIMYDVVEEELELDPTNKFAIKECPQNFPKGYLRALKLQPDTGKVETNFLIIYIV
ncbi:hypothetical protein TNCV_1241391 [Trichonephila clavipes]|uniref:Uncharacterized protein n=1 Tax=Trichonephila clavipes TaxID=2585209 RepID=A0A8X7BK57_TRICX|nr:hypothetical protein TNCV_1241391 [Trichonephila clavipes]